MAWTAPMTAIAGSVFTAAQFNTFVRDNFNECPTSKATTPGSYFVTSATNQMAQRLPTSDFNSGSGTTTATSYTDLTGTGIGPIVSVTTASFAIVSLYTNLFTSGGATASWMSFDVTGATTAAALDSTGIELNSANGQRIGATILYSGLTPGVNVFTARYRVTTANTANFSDRRLAVLPF
jgi:hypothetical protein